MSYIDDCLICQSRECALFDISMNRSVEAWLASAMTGTILGMAHVLVHGEKIVASLCDVHRKIFDDMLVKTREAAAAMAAEAAP